MACVPSFCVFLMRTFLFLLVLVFLSLVFGHRQDVVFSQALTMLVTGFISKLHQRYTDQIFVHQIIEIGFLFHLTSLLSTQVRRRACVMCVVCLLKCDTAVQRWAWCMGNETRHALRIGEPTKQCGFTLCAVVNLGEEQTVEKQVFRLVAFLPYLLAPFSIAAPLPCFSVHHVGRRGRHA